MLFSSCASCIVSAYYYFFARFLSLHSMFAHGIIGELLASMRAPSASSEQVLFFDIQVKNIIHEIMLVYSVAGLPTLPYIVVTAL